MTRISSPLEAPLASRHGACGLRAPALIAAAVLAGCTTAPLSFISGGNVYHRQVLNRYPARVVAVDGSYTAFDPVPISPGPHSLLIAAAPVAGFRVPVEKTYSMNIAPCTRYHIAAQRTSPLLQDWNLVVEDAYRVAGCNPAQELEKAKAAAALGAAPQSSSIGEAPTAPIARNAPR